MLLKEVSFPALQKILLFPFSFLHTPTVDLPLHQDTAARFVPWMVGVMLYVTFLFSILSILLFQGVHHQLDCETPHLTFEIPASVVEREQISSRMIRTLQAFPEVMRLRAVSPEEIKQTFFDFFDEPLPEIRGETRYEPLLLDVWTQENTASHIAEKVRQRHPDVQVLLHRSWTQPLVVWVSWMKWGFLSTAVFLLSGILTVVAFAVRTGVSIHQPILEILDLMGASSSYITRQFQRQTFKNTFKSLSVALFLLLLSGMGLVFFLENSASLHFFFTLPVLTLCILSILFLTSGVSLLMWGITRWVVRRALEHSQLC